MDEVEQKIVCIVPSLQDLPMMSMAYTIWLANTLINVPIVSDVLNVQAVTIAICVNFLPSYPFATTATIVWDV